MHSHYVDRDCIFLKRAVAAVGAQEEANLSIMTISSKKKTRREDAIGNAMISLRIQRGREIYLSNDDGDWVQETQEWLSRRMATGVEGGATVRRQGDLPCPQQCWPSWRNSRTENGDRLGFAKNGEGMGLDQRCRESERYQSSDDGDRVKGFHERAVATVVAQARRSRPIWPLISAISWEKTWPKRRDGQYI